MKKGFVIHHNGPPAACVGQPHARCERFWNAVRDFHVNSQGWSDIAYSFGVCPHGIRFEGRGWFKNQFANGSDVVGEYDGKDSEWYTVLVFLGGDEKPTAEMVAGVVDLIGEGRGTGRCGQRVLPHNAFKVKACPGPEFTAYANAWDNNTLAGASQEDDMYDQAARDELISRIDAMAAGVKQLWDRRGILDGLANLDLDVDEAEVARQVLAGLSPEAIAQSVVNAMPAQDAEAVASAVLAQLLAQLKEKL